MNSLLGQMKNREGLVHKWINVLGYFWFISLMLISMLTLNGTLGEFGLHLLGKVSIITIFVPFLWTVSSLYRAKTKLHTITSVALFLAMATYLTLCLLITTPVTPYTVSVPGRVSSLDSIVESKKHSSEHIHYVTVTKTPITNKLSEIKALLSGAGIRDRNYSTRYEFIASITGFATSEAQTKPVVAAHKYLGKPITYSEELIAIVSKPLPGFIKTGDVIQSINDTPVLRESEMRNTLIMLRDTTDLIVITIKRNNEVISIRLPSKDLFNKLSDATVNVRSKVTVQNQNLPVTIHQAANISGDSDGLAKTLEIIQRETSLNLHGKKILATGSIQTNGDVTGIGGVTYKYLSAMNQNVDIFFVPSENQGELEDFLITTPPSNVKVYYVSTLNEAMDILNDL